MLNPEQLKILENKAWIHDHDWELFSLLAGEPHLIGDFLSYWDGTQLSVSAWPIEQSMLSDDLKDRVYEIVPELLDHFHPLAIDIWGPHEICLAPILPKSFHLVSHQKLNPDNVNLQIRLHTYRLPKGTHLENARRAGRRGYVCTHQIGSQLTWQHLQLIEHFLCREDLTDFDRVYTAIEPWISRFSTTRIFSAYESENLLGFKSMREISPVLAVSKSSYYRKGAKHASDFLNHQIIEYYLDSGFRILDLGYSGHRKLLDYKLHWKPNINNGPYEERVYAFRSYQPNAPYSPWWARDIICPNLRTNRPKTGPQKGFFRL